MALRSIAMTFVACLMLCSTTNAANTASGTVVVEKLGTITAAHAAAYRVRDQFNARVTRTEILLTDVPVNTTALATEFDPHMAAINLPALNDRNYILLWVNADSTVSMNATFSKTMTQIVDDTSSRLKITWTTNSPARLEGRLFTAAPLQMMDGTKYTVDLKFGVDVAPPPTGVALPAGGGDAARALLSLVAAAQRKDWAGIKSASSPEALKIFDRSYNSPAENAADVLDMLKAWLPLEKMTVTGGQLRGDVAVLDVEGEMFPGMKALSLARMVRTGATWRFDRAMRAGMLN